jgi:hypothetical protein
VTRSIVDSRTQCTDSTGDDGRLDRLDGREPLFVGRRLRNLGPVGLPDAPGSGDDQREDDQPERARRSGEISVTVPVGFRNLFGGTCLDARNQYVEALSGTRPSGGLQKRGIDRQAETAGTDRRSRIEMTAAVGSHRSAA